MMASVALPLKVWKVVKVLPVPKLTWLPTPTEKKGFA